MDESIELYNYLFKLKRLDRFGWTKYDIKNPESVAEHSFGLAILALTIAPKLNLDVNKALTIALIHDLGESIIGDIQAPEDSKQEVAKRLQEDPAISKVLSLISDDPSKLKDLWLDFEEGISPEAKFIKELDKIEMCLQALSYEQEQGIRLDEFFNHTEKRLTIPKLKAIFQDVLKERP